MVYTVTLNPSIDYIMMMDGFETGKVNRSTRELVTAGGKGINVSFVLHNLGIDSIALGFAAGFTGDEIRRRVKEYGICEKFINLPGGLSRINVKLRADMESEINGSGPAVSEEDFDRLLEQMDCIADGDTLVLAGSVPPALPEDAYLRMMRRVSGKKIMTVADTAGESLRRLLPQKPFLIKPNNNELEEFFGRRLEGMGETAEYAVRLQHMGARNVLVSLAADGALLLTENSDIIIMKAPDGEAVNSVGAGDSMVAGFIYGYSLSGDYREALKWGVAAGSASAFGEQLGDKKRIHEIYGGMV